GPAVEEPVHLLHHHLHGLPKPGPVGQLSQPVPCVLHSLVRGPAGQEGDRRPPGAGRRSHHVVGKSRGTSVPHRPPVGEQSESWLPSAPVRVRPATREAASTRPRPVPGTCTSPARRRRTGSGLRAHAHSTSGPAGADTRYTSRD